MTSTDRVSPLLLIGAIILAIFAVSFASIFIHYAQEDAPSLVIAAYRLFFAAIFLAPVAWSKHREELQSLRRKDFFLALLSGAFLAVHFATWISSLEYTSVASSVVLVSTSSLWVALLSPFFLKEKLSRYVILGTILTLLGGSIVGISDTCVWTGSLVCPSWVEFTQGRAFFGNFLALVGAWAVAGYLMIGRRLRAKTSLIPYIFLVYGMAAVILAAFMFLAGDSPFGYKPMTYLWMLLLALVPQLIGHSTYNWILRYLPAAFVSITTLGEPIGSTILAYFLLQESPSMMKLIGGGIILVGIYTASRKTI
jgi:drug/metabolite transporter (DMT)-like permease